MAKEKAFVTERKKLDDEKEEIESRVTHASDIIELDVGGVTEGFKVRRSLLCTIKGSALETMFSGRHSLPLLENGKVFVDRDPRVFLLLINYLRNNMVFPKKIDEAASE